MASLYEQAPNVCHLLCQKLKINFFLHFLLKYLHISKNSSTFAPDFIKSDFIKRTKFIK